jgi:oligopeptide transport system substrate-binding protein
VNPTSRALCIATIATLVAPGCRDAGWGERAPFVAAPPPERWTSIQKSAPAPAPAEAKDGRVWGEGRFPCEGHPACERRAPPGGTLGLTVGGFEFLDPGRITEQEGFFVASNLFEGLINPSRRSGEAWEQGVATSWTVSEDGRVYTFTLREDARWSNGRQVTADDFVYAWRRVLAPETASNGVDALLYLRGAKAFNEGRTTDPASLGVRAVDPRTLEVTLECPTPYWPTYLASGAYLPVPREAIEAHGRLWDRPEHIVTNGPYHLIELKERDRLVLVRSETYWDKANVRIPKVVAYHAETEQQALALYEAGDVQYARGAISPTTISAAINSKRPDLFVDPLLCVYYYMLRTDRPPLDDVRVRQALDLAIDKQALVKHVTRGMQLPADGIVPSSFAQTQGYKRPPSEPFDPDKARALLAAAGYPNGKGLPRLKLVYNTMESHKAVAEFVARELEDNLGIAIDVQNMEWKSLLQTTRLGDFELARLGACGTDTPISFLENFKSDSARNDMRWRDPAFDQAFERARCGSATQADHLAEVSRAEALIMAGRPVIPLYWYTRPYFRAPVIGGIDVHVEDFHPLKYLWWQDSQTAPARHPMPAPSKVPAAGGRP